MNLFHSYGTNEALAITIALNWDILSFLPIFGLSGGLMSLVGRYMGGRQPETAAKATMSGLKFSLSLTLIASMLFLTFTTEMIEVFLPGNLGEDRPKILELATFMLRTVSIYIFANAFFMMLSSALRAAGDTRVCMWASIILHWLLLVTAYLGVRVWFQTPQQTWSLVLVCVAAMATTFILRYRHGKWKTLVVV